MLKLKNLHTKVAGKEILKGIDLEVNDGEIHVIMGPNGSGKSTLSKAIMGVGETEITKGKIHYKGKDITEVSPDERAHLGIFLANQYPVEIPGVNLGNFLRIAYNSRFKNEKEKLTIGQFQRLADEKLELLKIDKLFLERNLNEGFSGGEKKKSEILQMAVLEPSLAILDETDSGLDVDALKEVFSAVKKLKAQNSELSLLIITHYEKVFEYITPDYVHVMRGGKIVKSGGKALADRILEKGFGNI